MTGKRIPSSPTDEVPMETGAALWAKRLARESKPRTARRRLRHTAPAPPAAFGMGKVLAAALSLMGLQKRGEQNALDIAPRTYPFHFDNLPPAFDGFRILHLSDFHFDQRPHFTERLCAVVSTIEADLCVMTGDYHQRHCPTSEPTIEGMRRLTRVVRAHCGIIGVLGNHDFSRFLKPFREFGVRILLNESVALTRAGERIWFIGVDDPHDFRCDALAWAARSVPQDAFRILLVHSPEIVPEAHVHHIHLYICGHTHGGQVCLPGIGAVSFNTRARRAYCKGPWRAGDLQGFTTFGAGTTEVPVRFNCPPEVALIELHRTGPTQGP